MGMEWLRPGAFFGSILYALLGVLVFWLSFIVIDKLTPYDLWKELVENRNMALGLVVAAMSLGRPLRRPRMRIRTPASSSRLRSLPTNRASTSVAARNTACAALQLSHSVVSSWAAQSGGVSINAAARRGPTSAASTDSV